MNVLVVRGKDMSKMTNRIKSKIYDIRIGKINEKYIEEAMLSGPILQEIEIETLNRCNGKCSFCPVNVTQPQREYAKMSKELFVKIIDELAENDYEGKISLFSNNEPFLDERIVEFHKYARKALPKAKFNLFTNGSLLDLEKFKEIVECLDTFTIDNYNDDLEVNKGLKEVWNYINENESYKEKVNFSMRLENEVLTSRGGYAPNKKKVRYQRTKCLLPYRQMVIRPDGKVSLCCNDALGKITLGDVSKDTIYDIWNSEEYKKIRNEMMINGRKNLTLCQRCDTRTSP